MKIECTIDRLSWILRKKYTLVCRGNLDGSRIISKLSLNMEEKPEEDTIFVGNYPLHCKGLCLQITKRIPVRKAGFFCREPILLSRQGTMFSMPFCCFINGGNT